MSSKAEKIVTIIEYYKIKSETFPATDVEEVVELRKRVAELVKESDEIQAVIDKYNKEVVEVPVEVVEPVAVPPNPYVIKYPTL
jgi:translation elongation factor P/translation initiation factor 5A